MKHCIWIITFNIFVITTGLSQIGGKGINSFLNLPSNARTTALGGIVIGIEDYDVGFAFANPAVLNEKMIGQFGFSHKFHFADISSSHANYGIKLPWYQIMAHVGFTYLSYGDFSATDIYGIEQGQFSAKDVALVMGMSKTFDNRLSIGVNVHFFNSGYEIYHSSGLGIDLGANYKIEEKKITFSAVIKNIDIQISSFDNREYARPDLQLGLIKRLDHLPLRIGVVAHNLQQWNIRYDDPDKIITTDFLGNESETSSFNKGIDNFFRHLIFSGEFLFGKKENLKLRFAYNHFRRKELSVDDFRSLAGFSGGIGLKIKGIRLDYGFAFYHLVGSSKHITISTNLGNILKSF